MTPLTDAQLDELARLEAGATQGEWFAFFRKGGLGGTEAEICADDPGRGTFRLATFDCGNLDQSDRDRNFICAARNALPALLAELRLLRALAGAMERHTIYPNAWPRMVGPAFRTWREWKDGVK